MGRQVVTRFAPSPNGWLHLGHALSAILNEEFARFHDGRFLLRIEDIDPARSLPEYEAAICEDLAWLGLSWERPVRRQSRHLDAYRAALDRLSAMGLTYPSFMSRGEVKRRVAQAEASGRLWPRDPDGAPVFPPDDKRIARAEAEARIAAGAQYAMRLDMDRAIAMAGSDLCFREEGDGRAGEIRADPAAWGDVILWRPDAPSSYHLSVVVDDAVQSVTDVIRGLDLFAATSVHRLLQHLLDLPVPRYRHHRLVLGPDGRKLSKSLASTGLRFLRAEGATPSDIRRMIGL